MIPQRELRNNVAEVLRRAERGERLIVTVGGRPVAELGPVRGAEHLAPSGRLDALFADAAVDRTWLGELAAERAAERADAPDPWSS